MADVVVDFGTELSCDTDIASDGRMVSGFLVVAQAIIRRWITPRGQLIGYPNYGFDITAFLNADITDRNIAELRAGAEAEAEQEETVDRCVCTTVMNADGSLDLSANVFTTQGPFTFVLGVSSVTLKLLSITPLVAA